MGKVRDRGNDNCKEDCNYASFEGFPDPRRIKGIVPVIEFLSLPLERPNFGLRP